jgi:hypothetical protein
MIIAYRSQLIVKAIEKKKRGDTKRWARKGRKHQAPSHTHTHIYIYITSNGKKKRNTNVPGQLETSIFF